MIANTNDPNGADTDTERYVTFMSKVVPYLRLRLDSIGPKDDLNSQSCQQFSKTLTKALPRLAAD